MFWTGNKTRWRMTIKIKWLCILTCHHYNTTKEDTPPPHKYLVLPPLPTDTNSFSFAKTNKQVGMQCNTLFMLLFTCFLMTSLSCCNNHSDDNDQLRNDVQNYMFIKYQRTIIFIKNSLPQKQASCHVSQ